VQIKPDEITSILKSRIESMDDGGADLAEVGTVLAVECRRDRLPPLA
jgi:F-type H+/Na+-transporting ATPase subunit alpha